MSARESEEKATDNSANEAHPTMRIRMSDSLAARTCRKMPPREARSKVAAKFTYCAYNVRDGLHDFQLKLKVDRR
jgi:hypothetical protein